MKIAFESDEPYSHLPFFRMHYTVQACPRTFLIDTFSPEIIRNTTFFCFSWRTCWWSCTAKMKLFKLKWTQSWFLLLKAVSCIMTRFHKMLHPDPEISFHAVVSYKSRKETQLALFGSFKSHLLISFGLFGFRVGFEMLSLLLEEAAASFVPAGAYLVTFWSNRSFVE